VAYTAEVSIEEMQSNGKTILLTEGPSDASILESSLELLYPHLAELLLLHGVDAMRVGGGAGNLATL